MLARLLLVISLLTSLPLVAAPDCDALSPECAEVGKWQVKIGVGVGVRTNPVMNNDNIPLILLPQISYNGERFFLQNLDLGFIFFEDDVQQFNLLVTPSYDQVFFKRWDANNFVLNAETMSLDGDNHTGSESEETPIDFRGPAYGPVTNARELPIDTDKLRKRRMAGLVGLEYHRAIGAVDLQLHALQEFTDYHRGQEVRLVLARHFHRGKHDLVVSAGAIWQSSEVLNYYYGIEEGEGGTGDYYYQPNSDISSVVRVDWSYQLNRRWSLTFTTAYRSLASQIRRSPIITEDKVITAFAGGVYHF